MTALLALLSSLVWGTSDFAAGIVAKRRPAAAVVGWSQALSLVVMTTLVLASGELPDGSWPVWALLSMVPVLAMTAAAVVRMPDAGAKVGADSSA